MLIHIDSKIIVEKSLENEHTQMTRKLWLEKYDKKNTKTNGKKKYEGKIK